MMEEPEACAVWPGGVVLAGDLVTGTNPDCDCDPGNICLEGDKGTMNG
jgi:hypothetical protein